jgi:hypothetical protein
MDFVAALAAFENDEVRAEAVVRAEVLPFDRLLALWRDLRATSGGPARLDSRACLLTLGVWAGTVAFGLAGCAGVGAARIEGRPASALPHPLLKVFGQTSCLIAEGQLRCWGDMSLLPSFDHVDARIPELVDLGGRVTDIDLGFDVSCGVLGTDALYCWAGPEAPASCRRPSRVDELSGVGGLRLRPFGMVEVAGTRYRGVTSMDDCRIHVAPAADDVSFIEFSGGTFVVRGVTSQGDEREYLLGHASERSLIAAHAVDYASVRGCALFVLDSGTLTTLCRGVLQDSDLPRGIIGVDAPSEVPAPWGCLWTEAGAVYCTNPTREFSRVAADFARVSELPAVSAVAVGRTHACALTLDFADVWCWGSNDRGQLGDGSTDDSVRPVHAQLSLR